MAIETIQKMISDAPAASKWWEHHLSQLVFSKKMRALISCVLEVGAFACCLRLLFEEDPVRSMLCVVGMIVLAVAGIVWSECIPKKFRPGLKMMNILHLRNFEVPATTEHQEPVFRLLLKVHSKDLHQCAKDLLPLRNTPLPAMWWVMVQEHVKEMMEQEKQQAMWKELCDQIQNAPSSHKDKQSVGRGEPFQSTYL